MIPDRSEENGLPRAVRVRSQRDFDSVWKSRKRVADHLLIVHWCWRNGLGPCRLGLSIGRKAGNAVVRNRWKRLVREAFRQNQRRFPARLDLVIRPQSGPVPATLTTAQVAGSLISLIQRIRPPAR